MQKYMYMFTLFIPCNKIQLILQNQNSHILNISNYTIPQPICFGGWPLSKLQHSNNLFYHYNCIICYQSPCRWRSEADKCSRRHWIIAHLLWAQIIFIIRITDLCCQIALPQPVEEYCHLSRTASNYVILNERQSHLRVSLAFGCVITNRPR